MLLRVAFACLLSAQAAQAATVVAYYGDDDGFGIGVTSGALTEAQIRATNATAQDAALTDAPMFNDALFQPQFRLTGSFAPFSISGEIVSATLTLRVAGLRVPPANPNRIFLDGNDIGRDLFDLISDKPNLSTDIDEVSLGLSSFFFPFLADGAVSLDRTRLLQRDDGPQIANVPLQVDFIRLSIVTQEPSPTPIPLPAGAPMLLLGLGLLALARRRKSASGIPG